LAAQKPSIPKGTRDFTPEEMVRRHYIFDTIRSVFTRFGYLPIETPAMENLSSLLGKYGEEGDKLLFRILNSGDFLAGLPPIDQTTAGFREWLPHVAEKGLRYDLTVPFARFVVQHQHELTFPFRRYQIQPVWRADRPQKGRYREFFQCDADVIGSRSLLNETELLQIIGMVFAHLGLRVEVRLNNRKLLAGIAEIIGHPDRLTDITVAIDKLDKSTPEKVAEELIQRGIPAADVEKLQPILMLEGDTRAKLETLSTLLATSETGMKGIEELTTLFDYLDEAGLPCPALLDIKLARGLNYYTGTIVEVKALDAAMGSICGGGRYDDLTGIFGLPGMSGVGISFGADRIYDVMMELNLFPPAIHSSTRVLFANFGREEERFCLHLATQLRQAGIAAEIYPDAAKIKKQMEYADRREIPYVVLIGQDEMTSGQLTLKNMKTGEQTRVSAGELENLVSC
jgi:histidyl-tRNA synthetase